MHLKVIDIMMLVLGENGDDACGVLVLEDHSMWRMQVNPETGGLRTARFKPLTPYEDYSKKK